MSKDLKDKTLAELERIVVGLGQKKYLAGYIFKFIQGQHGRDISALSTLSKAFRAQLVEQGYFISQLKVVQNLTDRDGSAKFLFELADGERIEEIRIEPSGETVVKVPVRLQTDVFADALREVFEARAVSYEFNGSVTVVAPIVGLTRVPFSRTGTIDPMDILRRKGIGFN